LTSATSCTPLPPDGGGDGGDDLTLVLAGDAARLAGEGDVLTLSASAGGGVEPYFFRWSQEKGPENVLSELTGGTVVTEPVDEQGDYVFRVTVTDSTGARRARFITVIVGPPGTGDGFDAIIEGPESIAFGDEAELTAKAVSLGSITYLWEVIEGSATLETPAESSTSVTDAELGTVGVQLTATEDDTGETVEKSFSFDVNPRITVDGPRIAVIGEAVQLSVEVEPAEDRTTFEWTIVSGTAELDDVTVSDPSITTELAETVQLELTVCVPVDDGSAAESVEEIHIVSVADLAPRVMISTRLGDLTLELDAEASPLTSANFLQYVDEGFYNGVLLHRYSCEPDVSTGECLPFVVQGGGYVRVEGGLQEKETTRDPVHSEADNGLSNVKYSVAMALLAGDPDSATTQFFINLSEDNAELDGTYTVFGMVVDGFDVLDAVTEIETGVETLIDPETGESKGNIGEVPIEDVVMESLRRTE